MGIARGEEVYNADVLPVLARGMTFTQEELEAARADRLPGILADMLGREHLEEFYSGLELTEFDRGNIAEALTPIPEDDHSRGWREGEALAEAWLIDHKECDFPWPFNRDLRHHRASLPGAELVGFTGADDSPRFAFGQVKTSKDAQHPPQVVNHGGKSLINQALQLRDDLNIKKTLVNYLLQRAMLDHGLVERAKIAATHWLQSSFTDIAIFGVLVRDVAHSRDDLAQAAMRLSQNRQSATRIEFYALYLPEGSIPEGPQHRPRQSRRRLR